MAVIKGKEKKHKKPVPTTKVSMSKASRRKLSRPQDTQPIPVVAV